MSSRGKVPEVEFRSFVPDDEAAVLDCLRECFEFEPDTTAWRHLMFDNPAGAPIIVLALVGEEVVSHISVVPRRIRAFGQEGIAGQWTDSMTRPAWRRQGLRAKTGKRARELSRARGFLRELRLFQPHVFAGCLEI